MVINRPSTDPRDQAIHAALRDMTAILRLLEAGRPDAGSVVSELEQPGLATYLRVMGKWVADLDGSLELLEGTPTATFAERRIVILLPSVAPQGSWRR